MFGFNKVKREAVAEKSTDHYIPYNALIDNCTVKMDAGYLQTIRLGGISHESADDEDLFIWKDQINLLLRNIASPHLALWSHVVRREQNAYPGGEYEGMAKEINDEYKKSIEKTTLMVNELYLTLIYRPVVDRVSKAAAKANTTRSAIEEERNAAREALRDTTSTVFSALKQYDPHLLSEYEKDGVRYSELLEFLAFLVNGETQPVPLPHALVSEAITTSRAFFGREFIELRGVVDKLYAATLAIKEYPSSTVPGFMDRLMETPFQSILTQSYTFLSRQAATNLIVKEQNKKINTGDYGVSQIEALDEALDDLVGGSIVMGVHHESLMIFSPKKERLRGFLSAARSTLADMGVVVAREDLSLEASFYAQLPGNFSWRPRPRPVTSKNFSGFSSFHNYPAGRKSRNQWGEAVTVFKTVAGSPYYFNFHEPRDNALFFNNDDEEQGKASESNHKSLANAIMIGPSGSGKTVLETFMLAQLQVIDQDHPLTSIIYDKDRGQEIFVRAMAGTYLPLLRGERTGFNPFRMEPTHKNIIFLQKLIVKMALRQGGEVSARQEREITEAVKGVMALSPDLRRLSAILSFLDPTEEDGIYARLQRWCGNGTLGWVFDNATDELDFNKGRIFGFDITEFLDDDEVRTPIIMYLFHRTEFLLDGRRLTIFMDEFWKMLEDPYFADFANNKLKTIRKQDGFLVLGTQSARDVIRSKIAHSIIEQCATMIFMPNPKAAREDYIDGFKLTEREYHIIKNEMLPASRRFLIKQGHNSVVAMLDLKGANFDDILAVLSGTTGNILLTNDIIKVEGDDPEVWLPIFQKRRREHL